MTAGDLPRNRSWLELAVSVRADDADLLCEILHAADALSVTISQAPTFELSSSIPTPPGLVVEPAPGSTPLWNEVEVRALFVAETDPNLVVSRLTDALASLPLPRVSTRIVAERDWVRESLESFTPMRFGTLTVTPSWQRHSVRHDESQPTVILDPGLAFGTGEHATTRLCLEWLAAHPPHDLTVVDYGTGSGILAIAAVALGATRVYAIDYDPQARMAAQANAARNQVEDRMEVVTTSPYRSCKLLLANIVANVLIELHPVFNDALALGGRLVMSGVVPEQVSNVRRTYTDNFEFSPPVYKDGWALICGTKTRL